MYAIIISGGKGHEFKGEQRGKYRKVWREEKEGRNFAIKL